ncbi:MAG: TetR/AcrR family transcriptional regulator [Anaerolineae bacterium]
MPRPPRNPEQVAMMRQKILDVAHSLVHEGGPEMVTIRRIAGILGVSHMTLYNYFPSRQSILDALREREMAHVMERRQEALERARAGHALEVLIENLNCFANMARRRPAFYRLLLTPAAAQDDSRRQEIQRRFHEYVAHLTQIIRIGMGQGAFVPEHDPAQAALTMLVIANGPMAYLAGGLISEEQFATIWRATLQLITLYLRGVTEDERPLESISLP